MHVPRCVQTRPGGLGIRIQRLAKLCDKGHELRADMPASRSCGVQTVRSALLPELALPPAAAAPDGRCWNLPRRQDGRRTARACTPGTALILLRPRLWVFLRVCLPIALSARGGSHTRTPTLQS
jgi:hypothetical protein